LSILAMAVFAFIARRNFLVILIDLRDRQIGTHIEKTDRQTGRQTYK
jgi:hypothetical protein